MRDCKYIQYFYPHIIPNIIMQKKHKKNIKNNSPQTPHDLIFLTSPYLNKKLQSHNKKNLSFLCTIGRTSVNGVINAETCYFSPSCFFINFPYTSYQLFQYFSLIIPNNTSNTYNKSSICMTKLLFIVLFCFVVGLATEDCFGEDCEFGTSAPQLLTITQAVPLTQYECRRAFWYYLKGANLIYQANIDTPEHYLLIFIFRNVVGTFLAIGKWSKEYQVAEIATFVRLGNGYSEDVQVLYQPVRVEPFIISLKLAVGEYLIEVNEEGEFKVNGELIEVGGDDVAPYDMDARVECVDKKIRERYWYYLDGRDPAKLLHSEPIATNKRTYVVVNYVNIVGHFLVIGSCDGDSTVIVHTFVRLGNGYPASEVEDVEPLVDLKPSVEEVNW